MGRGCVCLCVHTCAGWSTVCLCMWSHSLPTNAGVITESTGYEDRKPPLQFRTQPASSASLR